MKRFIIEFGIGLDIHGQDVTKAAIKAVRDAISKSCLIGLNELFGFSYEDMNKFVFIDVVIGVTKPDELDENEIKKVFPVGQVTVKSVLGGLRSEGLYLTEFNDKDDSIEAAVACVKVYVKKDGR